MGKGNIAPRRPSAKNKCGSQKGSAERRDERRKRRQEALATRKRIRADEVAQRSFQHRMLKEAGAAVVRKKSMAISKRERLRGSGMVAHRRSYVRTVLRCLVRGRRPRHVPKWWYDDRIRRSVIESAFA